MSWEEISSDVAKAMSKLQTMEKETGKPVDPRYILPEKTFPELSAFAVSLKEFRNGYPCAWSGQGGHGITPGMLVAGMLRCIRDGHTLQAIADAYHHAFHGTDHVGCYSTPLYGVEFQGIHDLSKKISLRPYDQNPRTESGKFFKRIQSGRASDFHGIKEPTVVMEQRTIQRVIFADKPENLGAEFNQKSLEYVVELLTCLSLRPIFVFESWYAFENPIIDTMFAGCGISGVTPTNMMFAKSHPLSGDDLLLCSEMHKAFEYANKQKIAVNRLTRACNRRDHDDAIIDLAIAYEALFADKSGAHGHKISTRCAKFLSSSYESRRVIRKNVSDLYDARSKLVHKGKNSDAERHGLTTICRDYVKQALVKAALDKRLPDLEELDLR